MLPLIYILAFVDFALAWGGKHGNTIQTWKRHLLERDSEPTCSCTDPSASGFYNYPGFASAAAEASTPPGYVSAFTNGHSWTGGDGYLGHTTIDEYDTSICAAICDSIAECSSFEICACGQHSLLSWTY